MAIVDQDRVHQLETRSVDNMSLVAVVDQKTMANGCFPFINHDHVRPDLGPDCSFILVLFRYTLLVLTQTLLKLKYG